MSVFPLSGALEALPTAVVFRTGLITDATVLAAVDATLAHQIGRWNGLSRTRVAELIDWRVRALDPAAVRTARRAEQERRIEFGDVCDGIVEFWGRCGPPTPRWSTAGSTRWPAQADPDDGRTKAAGGVDRRSGLPMAAMVSK